MAKTKRIIFFVPFVGILLFIQPIFCHALDYNQSGDSDNDNLKDWEEINIYHTNSNIADTNSDGYSDGLSVAKNYDPNAISTKLSKIIIVNLKTQTLSFFLGKYQIGSFLISSGIKNKPTPKGNFTVLSKILVKR